MRDGSLSAGVCQGLRLCVFPLLLLFPWLPAPGSLSLEAWRKVSVEGKHTKLENKDEVGGLWG